MIAKTRKRIFSGIQPSGTIHIGNYFGALENWCRLTSEYECYFCVVDYHAMTIAYHPEDMRARVRNAVLDNIAAGLDPERCILFIQSDVPEHTELFWYLNTVTPMGDLGRMTQFKEKAKKHHDNINAGLLNYPILQAADILIYHADAVPVGEDQAQHIEFTREVARRFNSRFGDYFPEPATIIGRGARIMGLDGVSKMSKSLSNYIGVTENPDSIWEKIRPAKTDEARIRRTDPGDPAKCNIFSYHKLVTPEDRRATLADGCKTASIGCIDCKKVLFENLMNVLTPIRERREQLESESGLLDDILATNAAKARTVAADTVADVKNIIGLARG